MSQAWERDPEARDVELDEDRKAAGESLQARRGRPPQCTAAERETRILDALERVVAAKGVEGASMAAIARAAGMSKRTLYVAFDSRDALFGAWVRRLRASLVRPLPPEDRDLPLPERLRRLLRREAQGGTSDLRLMVLRAVVAEAPKKPEVARTFFREGPAAARRIVADELARAAARGEVALDDVETAARLLCDMAYPSPLDHLIDPDAENVPAATAEARLAWAIDVFLHGVAVGPTAAGRRGTSFGRPS